MPQLKQLALQIFHEIWRRSIFRDDAAEAAAQGTAAGVW